MKRVLRVIWNGWKKFAHALGVFNTKVILTILYFTIIGFAGLIVKLTRRDLLDRRFDEKGTLWKTHEDIVPDLEHAKRQF